MTTLREEFPKDKYTRSQADELAEIKRKSSKMIKSVTVADVPPNWVMTTVFKFVFRFSK